MKVRQVKIQGFRGIAKIEPHKLAKKSPIYEVLEKTKQLDF